MTPFNSELQVGQQALIIGCRLPENAIYIGKVVTVEAFLSEGETVPNFFSSSPLVAGADVVIVSGISSDNGLLKGYGDVLPKHLMPLPPLGDVYDEEVSETLTHEAEVQS